MTTKPRLMDARGLLELPRGQSRYELVRGELRTSPLEGCEHGALTAELGVHLAEYTHTHRLGRVYGAGTGFKLTSAPDTVRAPDVAFVSAERLQRVTRSTGYFPGPPDLVAEIISPNDRHTEVEEKVEMWLEHGTKMVATLNPETRTATVYRSLDTIRMIRGEGQLGGEEVIPGWALPLEELFSLEER